MKLNKMKFRDAGEYITNTVVPGVLFVSIIVGLLFGLILIPIYKHFTTDNIVTFCYIAYDQYDNNNPMLMGNVEWNNNRILYKGKTFDDIIEAAKKHNCTLK